MLAVAGTTDCLVHLFWSVTAGDDDWLVTELSAGFLDKNAQFHADVTLRLVGESPAFFINANLAVANVWRNECRKWR